MHAYNSCTKDSALSAHLAQCLSLVFLDVFNITRPVTNSMPVFMENVHCSDDELNLLDCSYSRNLSRKEHFKDVGIICKKCKDFAFSKCPMMAQSSLIVTVEAVLHVSLMKIMLHKFCCETQPRVVMEI